MSNLVSISFFSQRNYALKKEKQEVGDVLNLLPEAALCQNQ